MKTLSLDYGRRRIGIATTDESGTIVRGLTTIDRKSSEDAITDILKIIDAEKPSTLIIGLPLDVENNETKMSEEIRSFANKIKERVEIPILFFDESYSSIKASEILFCRKQKDRRKKVNIDRIAACIILESYIKEPNAGYQ